MRKLLFAAVVVAGLAALWFTQTPSLDRMGERRFAELDRPSTELLVGICWPFAVNRDGMADGLDLALKEITTQNMAGGYTIRLVMRDDDFDWQKAKRIAVEFADTPAMSAVIGYYDDAPAVKASAIYESSRLLHLIAGANNTGITSHGFKYVVRTTLSSNKIARSLARMTADRGYKKVALIWEEDAYGEDLAYQYRVGLDNLDLQLVYRGSYSREHPDFRLSANELKAIDADVVMFAGLEPWAGDFLRTARAVGLRAPIIGAFSDTPEMRQRAGKGLDGAMYFDVYSANAPGTANQAFVQKFRSRYGRSPDTWAAQGYDALHLLAKAAQFTRSRNPLDLSYAIRYMDAWEGANGLYKFDGRGELDDKPLFLNMYQHGVPVTVQQSRPATEPAAR